MDSFEMNKIIGALLGVVFAVFSLSIISDALFASPPPAKPGYVIEAAEDDAHGAGEAEEEPEPIANVMAEADASAGENIFKRCQSCHTVEQGGANKVGPNLWNIVMHPVASHEGFSYSGAMQEFAEGGEVVWDYEHLSEFLAAPKSYIPGTAMAFAGLRDIQDRADVIAYLREHADSPEPLPEPVPEAESAEPQAVSAEGEPAAEGEASEGQASGSDEVSPQDAAEGAEAPAAEEEADPAEGEATTEEPAPEDDEEDEESNGGAQ